MTATGETFKRMLRSHDGRHCTAFDEFVVVAEGFRVRLMGETLELFFEAASGSFSLDSANALAEKYVGALRKRGLMLLPLMTEEEWVERTTPPFGRMRTISTEREDPSRVANAVREARNELLASEDEALRRCYNHLQDARERMCKNIPGDESVHVAAYKAMEVLEEIRFGSEQKARDALPTLEEAKKAAGTKRHIWEIYKPQLVTSEKVIELATQVIRNYEGYLLEEKKKKKQG